MAGKVIFECQKPLKSLLSNCKGFDEIYAKGEDIPDFDYHIQLMSLPGLLGTNLDSIPMENQYIKAPDSIIEHWSAVLSDDKKIRVGIAWQGNIEESSGRLRSFEFEKFDFLFDFPEVSIYSLQIGPGSEQIAMSDNGNKVKTFPADFDKTNGPFMDTAAVMNHLDLIITCDTSIAHLAGAVGNDVWLLLPFSSDWRWLLERVDSPWYPTMKLFRQTELYNWQNVMDSVHDSLKKRLEREIDHVD